MPTTNELKQWARENKPLAVAACEARAFAETMRRNVDSYKLPLFRSYEFRYSGELCKALDERGGEEPKLGQVMTDENDLCLIMGEADQADLLERYFAEMDRLHLEHGHKGLTAGQCPALIAEHLRILAEGALVDSLAAFMGLDEGQPYILEDRKTMLDLALGACLNIDGAPVKTIFGKTV